MCRRIAEGLIDPHSDAVGADGVRKRNGSATGAYLYLLQRFGLMEPTRLEENIMRFLFAFLYLTLDTLFKGGISGARAKATKSATRNLAASL